jgi:glycosyltransferase involved in cell wall biosynthesis
MIESETRTRWLIVGMGSMAFGKERRAVSMFKHTPRVHPHFLTTIWEDGTVAELLHANGFDFTPVTIGYLGRARLRWTLINIWHMPKLFWTVVRLYRTQKCQGVVVLALVPFANVLPALVILKIVSRMRLVPYLGDIPAETASNRILGRVMTWMAHAVIVNSEAVSRGLENIGVPRGLIRVVYNGLALERFRTPLPFEWHKQFAWPTDILVIGYAGQLTRNKGVFELVLAAERVLKCTDDCRFALVGKRDEGNDFYRELATYIRERELEGKIIFSGWAAEMERAYATMDLIVVPSKHEEAGSNVIIEAMASGLPVIATRTGGTPELVRDGVTGFLVDKEKPEQIAEKILLLSRDRGLLRQIGSAAREHAHAFFDAKQNALQVQEAMLDGVK